MSVLRALVVCCAAAQVVSCGCGFGGPGCGEPSLTGLCSSVLPPSHVANAVVVYEDDTGEHAALVRGPSSSDPVVLEVSTTAQKGLLVLTTHAPGVAALTLSVGGWSEPWAFDLTVEEGATAPGGECVDARLRGRAQE